MFCSEVVFYKIQLPNPENFIIKHKIATLASLTLHRYIFSRSPHRLVDKAMCARTAGERPPRRLFSFITPRYSAFPRR